MVVFFANPQQMATNLLPHNSITLGVSVWHTG